MDDDILETVHSIFGKSVKIVDCEKTSSVQQEEILLINGVPVKLDSMPAGEGEAIKSALLEGQVPSVDLLNQLLYKAGLLQQSIQLETSLSVKSSLTTTEEVLVSRQGRILEEQISETKEDYIYQSNNKEILQPIQPKILQKISQKTNESVDEKCKIEEIQMPQSNCVGYHENFATKKAQQNDDSQSKKCYSSNSLNSSVVEEPYPISSNLSNYSTFSVTASPASSNAVIKNTRYPLVSNSNISNADFSRVKRSDISLDSGHDGVFHSQSQNAVWPQHCQATAANSLSSCYDIVSSTDETDQLNNLMTATKLTQNLTCQLKKDFLQKGAQIYTHTKPDLMDGKRKYVKAQTQISPNENYTKDEHQLLIYCDDKPMSGALDTCIAHLVPKRDYYPSNEYEFMFLLNTRFFLPPHELLVKITKIWQLQVQSELRTKSTKNFIQLLNDWMDFFPNDFCDDIFKQQMQIIYEKHPEIEEALQQRFAKLNALANIANVSNESPQHKAIQQPTKNANKINVLMHLCDSSKDLAHQLTAIELEYLSHINSEEFVHIFCKDFQHYVVETASQTKTVLPAIKLTVCTNDMKCRNVEAYIKWFNRLSYITATEIIKYPKKKQRARAIEYWIETARECFNIGNFNSLMAILIGLNLTAISRLKKTWSKVKSAKFVALEHQMDPTSNFNSYRSTMKAAVWRSEFATHEHERIIIPFFTLLLKDLYYISEGCRTKLPNNHINLEMCTRFANQIKDFNKWKMSTCPFKDLPNVMNYLRSAIAYDEATLMMSSYAYEPPESAEEKELYKRIKNETNRN